MQGVGMNNPEMNEQFQQFLKFQEMQQQYQLQCQQQQQQQQCQQEIVEINGGNQQQQSQQNQQWSQQQQQQCQQEIVEINGGNQQQQNCRKKRFIYFACPNEEETDDETDNELEDEVEDETTSEYSLASKLARLKIEIEDNRALTSQYVEEKHMGFVQSYNLDNNNYLRCYFEALNHIKECAEHASSTFLTENDENTLELGATFLSNFGDCLKEYSVFFQKFLNIRKDTIQARKVKRQLSKYSDKKVEKNKKKNKEVLNNKVQLIRSKYKKARAKHGKK